MKSSGGRKKNKSAEVKIIVAIVLLVIIIIAAIWLVSPGKSGSNDKPSSVGNSSDSEAVITDNSTKKALLNESKLPDATTPVQMTNESGNTVITLGGDGATVSGVGAATENGLVLISRAGVYEVSGTLNDGRIVVSAKGEDVVIVLNGVNVSCSYSAPLYVYKANSVTLIANGTTENVFTDGSSYNFSADYCDAVKEEPNAAVFSKADLILRGTGTIKVNSNYSSGIICKDNLKIVNTTVEVNSVNNGINGKDSLTIQNSTVNITAQNDGLRSTKDNDASLGYAVFTDSNIYINAQGDGVQCETGITIDNCSISIVSGGGAFNEAAGSQKGLKCNQGYVTINSGNVVLDCADDSINAAGDVNINGGIINLSSGDDAAHADNSVNVNGGTLVVTKCREGLEGVNVNVNNGTVYVNAKSKGLNAASDIDSSDKCIVAVNDGYVYINSEGDGVKSRGDILMNGGTLLINGPSKADNFSLSYGGKLDINGGTLLASGLDSVAASPDAPSQNCIFMSFDSTLPQGTFVSISGNGQSFVFKTEVEAKNMLFSSPMLQTGKEYTISYSGKYSGGDNLDCAYTGGKYSGGKDTSVTLNAAYTECK